MARKKTARKKAKRKGIPDAVATNVLTKSRRRCCLCHGLDSNFERVAGQIAHLDKDPSNKAEDNLVWLCLRHHDEYDSTTSQAKGLTIQEVKQYRSKLYVAMQPWDASSEQEVELTLPHDLDAFTDAQQNKLLQGINELLGISDVVVVRKRPGSVILAIRLSRTDARCLLYAVEEGQLKGLGVDRARVVPQASFLHNVVRDEGSSGAGVSATMASLVQPVTSGDIPEARRQLKRTLEAAPDDRDALCRLGQAHVRLGELDDAEEVYRRVLDLSPADESAQAAAYAGIAVVYRARGDLDQAVQLHKKALAIYKSLGLFSDIAGEFGNLAVVYRMRGDLEEAGQLHRKSLAIFKKLDRPEEVAIEHEHLASIEQERGHFDEAEQAYCTALEMYENLDHLGGIASVCSSLGRIYRERDLTRAETMHRRSLAAYGKLGLPKDIAGELGNLAVVTRMLGRLDEAERLHRQALEIFETLTPLPLKSLATEYTNLGVLYIRRGETERALDPLSKALVLYDELDDTAGIAAACGNLGGVYRKSGDLDAAELMHQRSLRAYKRLGRASDVAGEQGNLALVYRERGELDEAEEMHSLALDMFEEHGPPESVALECVNRANTAERAHNWELAREMVAKAIDGYRHVGAADKVADLQRWNDKLAAQDLPSPRSTSETAADE